MQVSAQQIASLKSTVLQNGVQDLTEGISQGASAFEELDKWSWVVPELTCSREDSTVTIIFKETTLKTHTLVTNFRRQHLDVQIHSGVYESTNHYSFSASGTDLEGKGFIFSSVVYSDEDNSYSLGPSRFQ